MFQTIQWRIAGLNNDVKFAINVVIGEFVKVETVDVIENDPHAEVPHDHDKHDVHELQVPVGLVVIDDDVLDHDDNQPEKTAETVEIECVLMVDDEVVGVDDDDDEDSEIDEMVEIDDTPINKFHDQTVEMVEIPECIERGENDDVVDPFIIHDEDEPHETVEIDIFDDVVVIEIHKVAHETVDVGWLFDDMVETHDEIKVETVDVDEMQSRMFIDSIWTQEIFGINASMQDDEMVVIDEMVHDQIATHDMQAGDNDETVQTVDKLLFHTIACTNNDVLMFVVVNDDWVVGHTHVKHDTRNRIGFQVEVLERIDGLCSKLFQILISQISHLQMMMWMKQFWFHGKIQHWKQVHQIHEKRQSFVFQRWIIRLQ